MIYIVAYITCNDYCMVWLMFNFFINIIKGIHAVVLLVEFDFSLNI